jgi:hypothetical protein
MGSFIGGARTILVKYLAKKLVFVLQWMDGFASAHFFFTRQSYLHEPLPPGNSGATCQRR